MRTLRRLCAAFVLTLALALSAFAGTMSTGVTAPPPSTSQATATGDITTGLTGNMPAGVTGEMTTGITGDISTGVTGQMSTGFTATDPATDILLSLLQSLLLLF